MLILEHFLAWEMASGCKSLSKSGNRSAYLQICIHYPAATIGSFSLLHLSLLLSCLPSLLYLSLSLSCLSFLVSLEFCPVSYSLASLLWSDYIPCISKSAKVSSMLVSTAWSRCWGMGLWKMAPQCNIYNPHNPHNPCKILSQLHGISGYGMVLLWFACQCNRPQMLYCIVSIALLCSLAGYFCTFADVGPGLHNLMDNAIAWQ